MLPFLKWPGGKRWLVRCCPVLLDLQYDRYVEPFLGGAAVFFSLRPKDALLSDLNFELIQTYQAIKYDWKLVRNKLKTHHRNHQSDLDYYYRVRRSRPTSLTGAAAKFIYLNRTCFNGLYRVNLRGEFNVPRGTKNSVYTSEDDFEKIAEILSYAELKCGDFHEIFDSCGKGDLIFVDPPYTVAHNSNGFLKYNEKIFSWDDQLRLAASIKNCAKRGAKIIVTNANHASIKELYRDIGEMHIVSRFSCLASDASRRNSVEELIVLVNIDGGLEISEQFSIALELAY